MYLIALDDRRLDVLNGLLLCAVNGDVSDACAEIDSWVNLDTTPEDLQEIVKAIDLASTDKPGLTLATVAKAKLIEVGCYCFYDNVRDEYTNDCSLQCKYHANKWVVLPLTFDPKTGKGYVPTKELEAYLTRIPATPE